MASTLFTSESVSAAHPDKLADQISDAILDEVLSKDPLGRVACETLLTTGLAVIAGEISTDCYVDIPRVVRDTITEVGYTNAAYGMDGETCGVVVSIDEQSPDISRGVEIGGAGDQGMMFGFACDETHELMPAPIQYAHSLVRELERTRRSKENPYLRPDGKAQVTVEYEDGKVARINTVVISAQHDEDVDFEQLVGDLTNLGKRVLPDFLIDDQTIFYINPTGRFVLGGPQADAGLTGRKIVVDTYGGYARHGGGCFSGKDPSKVDRSGAYGARYVAKNIVAAKLASKCEIQIAYAIGVSKPVSISLETFGTETINKEKIISLISENFDLSPFGLIKELKLRRPIYKQVAAYGHFGRSDLNLPWEDTSISQALAR
jgi:S-adenosylmethionine synthetase